jgi:hypothetical protein
MTMKNGFLTAILVGTLAVPASAATFTAENSVKVTSLAGKSFEVAPDRKFGVPGQWCGAADYAKRVLGVTGTERLYVQGQGSTRRSVVFGLDPAGATPSSISVVSNSANTPGANFSVQRAFLFCIEQRVPNYLFFRP